jgi:hypothetical protein
MLDFHGYYARMAVGQALQHRTAFAWPRAGLGPGPAESISRRVDIDVRRHFIYGFAALFHLTILLQRGCASTNRRCSAQRAMQFLL